MNKNNANERPKHLWITREIHVITRTPFTPDCSLQRDTVVEQNWLTYGEVMCGDQVQGHPLRFTTSFDERLDKTIPPCSRLIIEQYRIRKRKGRDIPELEVKRFRVVGPDWSWIIGSTQLERDIEFLKGGSGLEDLFGEHSITSLFSTTL
jgi:hypothetical protein